MFWTITIALLVVLLGAAWWRDRRDDRRNRSAPDVRKAAGDARAMMSKADASGIDPHVKAHLPQPTTQSNTF